MEHKKRAHSKFAASAATRWFNCPGSVQLSEGLPDRENQYSKAGTKAHEVLEKTIRALLNHVPVSRLRDLFRDDKEVTREMMRHALDSARFMIKMAKSAELLIETKIFLEFIHEEMFGTFDGAILDHFGTLHVFDYKYGQKTISPKENLQMIFYGLGLAFLYRWNFKRVRFWVIQPRIRGYDGPVFWEISISELRAYEPIFREAVLNVERNPRKFKEGEWCFWCKAKTRCPLKREAKLDKAVEIFRLKKGKNGQKEETPKNEGEGESEASWRKEKKKKKTRRRT